MGNGSSTPVDTMESPPQPNTPTMLPAVNTAEEISPSKVHVSPVKQSLSSSDTSSNVDKVPPMPANIRDTAVILDPRYIYHIGDPNQEEAPERVMR